jgi:hypothetical protein
VNDLFVLILIIASAAAYTGYRIGRHTGFHAGRGDVFDEVIAGDMPYCAERNGVLVARFSPTFPTTISAGIQDQLVKNPASPVPPPAPGTRYVHPFLEPVQCHG